MNKVKTNCDVFISHDRSDATITEEIARIFRSYDLSVFTGADLVSGQTVEDAIWEAMSESQALVAIIPEFDPSAGFAFELGAAKAWNKPIYAVASNPTTVRLPFGLPGTIIYPVSRIEEIAQEIKKGSELLTEADRRILADEYARLGIPVDQLLLQTKHLTTLTKQFKKRSKRNVSTEELMRTLLRLRKRGELHAPMTSKHPEAI